MVQFDKPASGAARSQSLDHAIWRLESGVTVVLTADRGDDSWAATIVASETPHYRVGGYDLLVTVHDIERARPVVLTAEAVATLTLGVPEHGPFRTTEQLIADFGRTVRERARQERDEPKVRSLDWHVWVGERKVGVAVVTEDGVSRLHLVGAQGLLPPALTVAHSTAAQLLGASEALDVDGKPYSDARELASVVGYPVPARAARPDAEAQRLLDEDTAFLLSRYADGLARTSGTAA